MLRLAIIALAGAAAVYAQAVFEGGAWFGEEDLEGRPKTVKIEREKLGDASILQPEEEWEYSANGNPLAHRQFAGGKLVANHAIITLYADRRAIKQNAAAVNTPLRPGLPALCSRKNIAMLRGATGHTPISRIWPLAPPARNTSGMR
jgi:hypothetical protein